MWTHSFLPGAIIFLLDYPLFQYRPRGTPFALDGASSDASARRARPGLCNLTERGTHAGTQSQSIRQSIFARLFMSTAGVGRLTCRRQLRCLSRHRSRPCPMFRSRPLILTNLSLHDPVCFLTLAGRPCPYLFPCLVRHPGESSPCSCCCCRCCRLPCHWHSRCPSRHRWTRPHATATAGALCDLEWR